MLNESVAHALDLAEQRLRSAGFEDTAALDASLLMQKCLGKGQAWQIGHAGDRFAGPARDEFFRLVIRRAEGVPVGYLLGEWGFWKLTLSVNESVLVPRPETETLIERVIELYDNSVRSVLDLGTGCGAIALAIALERPHWHMLATDVSGDALAVAQDNSEKNGINNVDFRQGSWFEPVEGERFDLIVSNPPYVDANDPHLLGSIRFEPRVALVSGDNGLADLAEVVAGAPSHLMPDGGLIVEHGFEQGEVVQGLFDGAGFGAVRTLRDLSGLERVTEGTI